MLMITCGPLQSSSRTPQVRGPQFKNHGARRLEEEDFDGFSLGGGKISDELMDDSLRTIRVVKFLSFIEKQDQQLQMFKKKLEI